jgi:PAS domain S-box-containing protein
MDETNDKRAGKGNPAPWQQAGALKAALEELPKEEEERAAALAKANEELRREIAYRSRVEEALRADLERFQMMIGSVKDYAILMLDTGGYIVSWNDGAEQIHGYARTEIIGRHFSCFYPPAGVEGGQPAMALQVAAAEGRFVEEGWRLGKGGAPFWASVVITALRDEKGVLRGFAKVTRDRTARKRTEEKLQLQARVIEKMTESVIVVDGQWRIVTANPATDQMFGYERGELIGRHISVLCQADEGEGRPAVAEMLASTQGGSKWLEEVSRRRKDGTTFRARTRASIFEVDGQPHFFAIHEDITERRRVEESLRASEERFSSAFESAAIGMALVGLDGRWLKVNRALCELVGYSEAGLLMRTFQDITHPDDLETDLEYKRKLVAGEIASFQTEKRYFHLRGHLVRVLLSVTLVRDAGGRPLYFISQIQDITQRKRAEEELLWKTAFLEAQVNCSSDGILVVDKEGRKILQNQRLNQVWEIPQPVVDDPDDKKLVQWIASRVKNPAPFVEKVVFLYSHPDQISKDEIELNNGTVLDRYSAPVIGRDGKYYGRIWTFRDITERKRLEAHGLQSQKLEIVGKLAGGVAHEFNSILTVILGQGEFLLSELPPASPLRNEVRDIIRAAERAAALTRQLLAYGRKQFLRFERLDLNQLIASMADSFRLVMGAGVEVRVLAGDGLRAVKADAGQIELVIMNLAINAHQAMPGGGQLTLETANVTLDQPGGGGFPELKPGGYVMLAITDTGTGMSEEVKARLFEPFFSTKDVGQGTGLGLATCHGIIKQCGGHISVRTGPGQGTTFKIYLPQVEQPAEAPAPLAVTGA